jgi:hypothetical protein
MMKFLILIFLLCSVSSAETFKVLYLKGTLEVSRNGKLVSPPVETGDRVKLSKNGLVVLKSETATLKLTGETIITPHEEVKKNKTIIDLVRGSVTTEVKKKAFEVKTKNAVFGVRGTEFFVSSLQNEDTWMCVKEGEVVAMNGKESIPVTKGLGVSVGKNAISKPRFFPWTKGISWVSENQNKDHKIESKYNILDNFYD